MVYEDDRFFIPEKYRNMSVEELEEEKEKYIKKIANEYKQKYNDFPEKLYNALINYEIDIDD